MGIITYIDNIPLFTTKREALDWGFENGLLGPHVLNNNGYHVHKWRGQTGFMGGINHRQAMGKQSTSLSPTTIPTPTPTPTQQATPTQSSSGGYSGSSSSSGPSGGSSRGSSGGSRPAPAAGGY